MYHSMWVVLAQTLDKSGIYELQQTRMDGEALRQKINDEALHGALRISALMRRSCW
jgi:hypothetical protein